MSLASAVLAGGFHTTGTPTTIIIQTKISVVLRLRTSAISLQVKDYSPQFPSQGASLIAQLVKNQPAMQKTSVQFLGQKDSLEKGKATHSSILTWRIPWTV